MKKSRCKKNNQGITLVEVLVAVAVSTIVVGAIWQFLLVSTRTYSAQKDTTDLQVEVQQAMNQMQDVIIDTNRAVVYTVDSGEIGSDFAAPVDAGEKVLEVYSSDKAGKLIWNKEESNVVYEETVVTDGRIDADGWESALLAEDVTSFAADVSQVEDNNVLKIKLNFEKKGKSYEATRNITLRNALINSSSVSDIYEGDAGTEVLPTVVITDSVAELKPRRSYDFNAEVVGADDQTLMWSIAGNQSTDTMIDIRTGNLVIGAGEPEGNKITVVATLVSDKRVSASTSVTVLEADPADIEITSFPEVVLCGKVYPIAAKVSNAANESYTWEIEGAKTSAGAIALSGDTYISGNTLYVGADQKHQEGSKADLIATASSVAYPNVKASDTAIVRKPEFTVEVKRDLSSAKNTDAVYDRGEQLFFVGDWSKSYAKDGNKEAYVDVSETGRPADITKGEIDESAITWYLIYKDTAAVNETKIEIKGNDAYLPVRTIENDTFTICGVSNNYPGVVSETTVKVNPLKNIVKATWPGKADGTNVVEVGKKVTFTASIEGLATSVQPSFLWEMLSIDGEGNERVVASSGQDYLKEWTVAIDNSYAGATFVIRARDGMAGTVGQYELVVGEYTECTQTASDVTLKYLYVNKEIPRGDSEYKYQYPFEVDLNAETAGLGDAKVLAFSENYTDGSSQLFANIMRLGLKDKSVVFSPQEMSWWNPIEMEKVTKLTYHVDMASTNAHVKKIALEPYVSNYSYSNGGKDHYIWLEYTASDLSNLWEKLGNKDRATYTQNSEFVNYYGETAEAGKAGTATTYSVTYLFEKSSIWSDSCTIMIKDAAGSTLHTVTYTKNIISSVWR